MSALKYLRKVEGGFAFYCSGCEFYHVVDSRWKVKDAAGLPTITPSVLNTQPWKENGTRCHLFVRSGKIQFLNDCTHSLAGKTVDMREEEE